MNTGEEMMRPTRIGLFSAVIVAVAVTAGCDGGNDSTGSGDAAAAASPTATSAAPAGGPAIDADTKAACTAISGEIRNTIAKATEAEKIGPPAGHSAVSAQYSAGAAALYVHMFDASGKVNDAAKQVATAMSDLADTYATAPKKAPSKATLNTAIKQFNAACAAT
jgi:hypothetical protein